MMINLDRLVDDILSGETTGDTILFTVPGDLAGFSTAVKTIRDYPCTDRKVVFCESIEELAPAEVLRGLTDGLRVIPTGECVTNAVLDGVKQVVIPILPGGAAEKLVSENAAGKLPEIWRAARVKGVPVCADLKGLRQSAVQNPELNQQLLTLERRLNEMGISDLCDLMDRPAAGSTVPPEMELVGELVHHLCDQCETEDGADCTSCGMCKVRGF